MLLLRQLLLPHQLLLQAPEAFSLSLLCNQLQLLLLELCLPPLQLLLPSLQLAACGRGLKHAEVGPLLGLLHQYALQHWQGPHRYREALQALYQYALPRQASPAEAAETEANWHLAVLQLANDPLLSFCGQLLLALGTPARLKKYQTPDEFTRTTQLQLRVNGALMEGDQAGALRALCLWCGTPPLPQTNPRVA